jgi:hypothetical protein
MATTVFTAEEAGAEHLRFWIYGEPSPSTEGWAFIVEKKVQGEWQPCFDTWERWFFEVLRYLPEYGAGESVWRWESTGETADLTKYQAQADCVCAQSTDTPKDLGLPD